MNAIEQIKSIKSQMKEIKEASVDANVEYFDKSWTILQDMVAVLEDRIERFGEKAFPLSEKQQELVSKILAEKAAKLPVKPQATEEAEIEAKAVEVFGTLDEFSYVAARWIVRGQMSVFEAKEKAEERRQWHDNEASAIEIFGLDYAGMYANRGRIFHEYIRSI